MLFNTCSALFRNSGQRSLTSSSSCESTLIVHRNWLIFRELLTDEMSSELPSTAKPQAALLISKVYFYMNIQEEAVEFALLAGVAFQQELEGEYRETIIGKSHLNERKLDSLEGTTSGFAEKMDRTLC